ncbi:MAG TPA: aminopeptidase [Bacteroidetes bacterium]|nr:aminopeptidase [Bacteroidota bacterium]
MKKILLFAILLFSLNRLAAQYEFSMVHDCNCTPVKSQGSTGTCWSFSTTSFLESELMREGKQAYDLSEMYFVRTIYQDKAMNYLLRQGKAQFSQGGLAHDVINAYREAGAVPESAYSGLQDGQSRHDHGEMAVALKGMLDALVKQKTISEKWRLAFVAIMDAYLGTPPPEFEYQGKQYTPQSFASTLGINPDDYVSFTSYTHHPFDEEVVLEIPDNYSNGSYFNVPFEDIIAITDHAVEKGYSVAWDGDVSEKGFSSRNGIAVLPANAERSDLFENPGEELSVDQALRQRTFQNYSTTDDHLMHITGVAKDQRGTKYYYTKNSWGDISPFQGYVYMSEPYFRLKTVGILVNKAAVPPHIRKRLGI